MKKKITLLFFILYLTACAGNERPETIDQAYLQSNDYQKFEQKFRKEAGLKENQDRSLEAHLQELGSCKDKEPHSFLLEINREKLSGLMEKSSEHCGQIVTSKNLDFNIRLVAENQLENYSLKWVLLNDETVYINWQLLAVTFRDGRLVDYKRVGAFQKNLSKDIDTEIKANKKGENFLLETETIRKIIYPFEQQNRIENNFEINSKGMFLKNG